MRPVAALAVAISVTIGIAACAPQPSSTPQPTSRASSAPPLATVAAAPDDENRVIVGADDISLVFDGETRTATYDDPGAVLGLFRDLTGEEPEATPVLPYDGLDFEIDQYDFPGVQVTAPRAGAGSASIALSVASMAGVPIATASGIGVGSSRAEAVAAGATDGYDDDQDGVADYLDLDRVEASGTESLATPGAPGSYFILLAVPDDVVTQIQAPSNDFADI